MAAIVTKLHFIATKISGMGHCAFADRFAPFTAFFAPFAVMP
jgi:hypothetical protein